MGFWCYFPIRLLSHFIMAALFSAMVGTVNTCRIESEFKDTMSQAPAHLVCARRAAYAFLEELRKVVHVGDTHGGSDFPDSRAARDEHLPGFREPHVDEVVNRALTG